MAETWPGGCQCGQVRYRIDADRVKTLCCCHCRDCQKQSGSAFGMSLIVPREAFVLERGSPSVWEHRSARGSLKRAHFCPRCGGRIFHDAGEASALVSVKAGTLDDTAALQPAGHLWTRRAQAWVQLPAGALHYEGEPETDEALYGAYRAKA
jgi:hypothetical protein